MTRKVAVIGLDCADPKLVFEEFWEELPNIRSVAKSYGPLRSTIPPITVPAWMSMVTSRDPGELGIYGFRNRKDYSYDSIEFASSKKVKYPTVWDTLSFRGFKNIIVSVPLTYPPKPLNGYLISGFLTPGTDVDFTYPPELKKEIESLVGEYMFDVPNFRSEDKDRLLRDTYEMTRRRFEVVKHLVSTKEWDFFMMVEIGVDRMHHAFWAHHDPTHFKHDPSSPYKNAIRDYYKFVDEKIGEVLNLLPDDTIVVIASDHGIQKMEGGIAVNDWLIEKGYLTLKEKPSKPTRISELIKSGMIDWSRTRAWGMGGYYGRIFINVEGREPEGVVPKSKYEDFRDELIEELSKVTDEHGNNIGTVSYKPQEVYKRVEGIPPDLIVYFGNLRWRSMGTVGNETIWLHENDTGPDDANHAQDGIVISSEGKVPREITQVRDFLLGFLGI